MEVPPSVEITDGQRLETEQLQDESSMDGVQQTGEQQIGEQQTGEERIEEQQMVDQQLGEQQTGEPQTGEQEMWGIRDGGRVLVSGTTTAPVRRSTRITRGNFFEKTWRTDPQMNQCVHSAFNCRTIWCIRSKVLSLLLSKGPKPGVEEVVDRDLRVVPPLVLPEIGSRTEREVQEGTVEPQMVRKGEGLRVQFDVSIHIRGLSINVEGDYCRNREDMSCRERAQQEEMLRVQELMKPTQWRCIARLMQFLRIKKAAAGGFTSATDTARLPANATAVAAGRTANATAARTANATAAAAGRTANASDGNLGASAVVASHSTVNTATKTLKAGEKKEASAAEEAAG
ncbi:unnamed protein product [Closterium sp. NIES-65]|nr:unnamed protein product [Closterium sp. NIES-65]